MKLILGILSLCLFGCANITPAQVHTAAQDAHQFIQDAKEIKALIKDAKGEKL